MNGSCVTSRAWLGIAVAWMSAVACGAPPRVPRTVPLRLRGAPPDALVTLDDRLIGAFSVVSARGIALPPGRHQLTIEAPGHFPWDRAVDAEGQRLELDVKMVPRPE